MNTENKVAWVLFIPTFIFFLIPIDPFGSVEIHWRLYWVAFFFWSLFLCFSFFSGLGSLIRTSNHNMGPASRQTLSGMNLWLLILPWITFEKNGLLTLITLAHTFNFLLHFIQTSIFKTEQS